MSGASSTAALLLARSRSRERLAHETCSEVNTRLGLSGRVPHRVDAATKTGLLDLLEEATRSAWSLRAGCAELELGELRARRWALRRDAANLDDRAPGGNPPTVCWSKMSPRSSLSTTSGATLTAPNRKLAHRGSYPGRVWVSPASVRPVLAAQGLDFNPPPRPETSVRKPFPDWVEYRPNQIWIYDTTHFTRCGVSVTIVEDLVSREWIADIVSSEETSTQVEIVFTDALAAGGLLAVVEARADRSRGSRHRR